MPLILLTSYVGDSADLTREIPVYSDESYHHEMGFSVQA